MNRPKRRTYVKRYGWEHTERYIQALETYTHYLEKVLDKACEELGLSNKQLRDLDNRFLPVTKEMWKEWLMKDE